jgi:hypothetical protein
MWRKDFSMFEEGKEIKQRGYNNKIFLLIHKNICTCQNIPFSQNYSYTGCIRIRPTNFQGRFYDQK